jgi:hypothetical protein
MFSIVVIQFAAGCQLRGGPGSQRCEIGAKLHMRPFAGWAIDKTGGLRIISNLRTMFSLKEQLQGRWSDE